MARTNQRGRNNNNPEGRNQYSSNGWMGTAKDRPMATAAAAAAAVGAGVFLWSRRNQISDQISNLSGQISDWADEFRSSSSGNGEMAMAESGEPSAIGGSFSSEGSARSGAARKTGSSAKSTRTAGRSQQRAQSGQSVAGMNAAGQNESLAH